MKPQIYLVKILSEAIIGIDMEKTFKTKSGKIITLDWRDKIKVGNVLIHRKSGTARIVRKVSYFRDGRINYVYFSIKRCSWTHSCYTMYGRYDIKILFKKSEMKRQKLNTKLDKKILIEMERALKTERQIDCCDVKEVIA